ncbi:MAG: phosphatidylserine/phosphatidylglycerophosphate/cardiolipin synthase family protein [Spirochaetia bacterium]|nr:phosphatidylserine/phosphatidylglycerophosphate/cardiolipin synthase family protein [Spirochaetia bacterium]
MKDLPWTRETLYFTGDHFFREIGKRIESARKSVDVESYIFENDELGRRLIRKLISAARRGVRVRVLVDALGSSGSTDALARAFQKSRCEFRIYHPLFGVGLLRFWRTYNRRNHRKVWLFDGREAWVGSMNVSRNHLVELSGTLAWRDFGVCIEGPGVSALGEAFEKTWDKRHIRRAMPNLRDLWRRKLSVNAGSPVLLNDSLPRRLGNFRALIRRIRVARRRVWFASAYFVPKLRLVRALSFAAKKGLDVRVLVPRESDVFFMPWITATYYFVLIRRGVKLYEYLPGMYHGKAQLIDSWAAIGSSNLNHRSILHDLEVDLVLMRASNRSRLEKELRRDFARSERLTLEKLRETPLLKRLAGSFLLLFRFWM